MIKKKATLSTELPDDIDQYLRQQLHRDIVFTETVDLGHAVYFPQWKLSIRPHLDEFRNEWAIIYHYLQCPAWDRSLIECSIGMREKRKDSLDTAQKSFELCMLTGIRAMHDHLVTETVETFFAEHKHLWDVSLSKLVIMGNIPENINQKETGLWHLLKEPIMLRLGNQKLTYVKIYGAKCDNDITAEVRINDVPSAEMSNLLHKEVSKWNHEGFCSYKQFILLKQHEETHIPYPYNEEDIMKQTQEAIRLFASYVSNPSHDFKDYHNELITLCKGDKLLAEELEVFLPELCAEHAFNKAQYPETLQLAWTGSKREETYYRAQLASYYAIGKGLSQAWNEGYFTTEVFQAYVNRSTIYNTVTKAQEKGEDINRDTYSINLHYNVGPEFEIK